MKKIPIDLIIEAIAVTDNKFKAMLIARSADPDNFSVNGRIEVIGLKKNQKEFVEKLTTQKTFQVI